MDAGYFFMLLLSSANFYKNSFMSTIKVSNSLAPNQDQPVICPDLGSNCLQRLAGDDKSHLFLRT